jgi:hypothetical protein
LQQFAIIIFFVNNTTSTENNAFGMALGDFDEFPPKKGFFAIDRF